MVVVVRASGVSTLCRVVHWPVAARRSGVIEEEVFIRRKAREERQKQQQRQRQNRYGSACASEASPRPEANKAVFPRVCSEAANRMPRTPQTPQGQNAAFTPVGDYAYIGGPGQLGPPQQQESILPAPKPDPVLCLSRG